MQEKWLIRLYDSDNDYLITSYYTENPEQQLKTFYFCKENDIPLGIPNDFENENYKYNDKEAGSIYDITVHFGSNIAYCTIDIWLEDIY